MKRITFSPSPLPFKPLNAVNNGPVHSPRTKRSNLEAFREARIPYCRSHDSSYFGGYGGEHTVDITAIFPDFSADVTDPNSYDFAETDKYVSVIHQSGAQIFFRLGQKIEHTTRKCGTLPPPDFHKWAQICEHIILHYTEGWADGFHYTIDYWEIWNEPDLDADDSKNKRTWGGTKAMFFDFFAIAATHLKTRFPHLKIGGPAVAGFNYQWVEDFLSDMKRRGVGLDFFSWHIYCTDPAPMRERARIMREMLDRHGYGQTESILNEWNFVLGWDGELRDSFLTFTGHKGTAFNLACMAMAHRSSIDMLMYYDARPCCWNGLFESYVYAPLKGYYSMLWYGMLYGLETLEPNEHIPGLYLLCGRDKEGKTVTIMTNYFHAEEGEALELSLDLDPAGRYAYHIVDEAHSGDCMEEGPLHPITLKRNSCVLIKQL